MAPSRKKSRKLGLEEEASSSEEAKKMYVFVSHDGWDYGYSLFALGIPSSGTIVKTKPTVVTTPSVKGVKSKIASRSEPERSPVLPILRFRQGDGWTSGMRCIRLGQKLYFLGGDYSHYLDIEEVNHEKIYPNQVYALDLSQEVNWRHRNHARKVLEQVASMNTGKDGFIVSFVADGKIFLVASGNKTKELVQFEIFSPSEGLWTIGARPPFGHHAYLYPPLVLGRKVYFYGHFGGFNGRFTCCYTIDDGSWSDYRVTKEDYDDGRWSDYRVTKEDGFINFGDFKCSRNDFSLMVGGVIVGESTVWNVCGQKVPAVVRLDITKEKQVEKKYFSSGLMHYIQPPAPADADAIAPDAIGTSLAAAAEDSRRLCFLQVDDGGVDPTRMSVILFDRAGGEGGESPEYLKADHYFVKMDSYNPTYRLIDAHIV